MSKGLPPVKRYITTTDSDGKAVWDDTIPPEVTRNQLGAFDTHSAYISPQSTHTCADDIDLINYRENPTETELWPDSGSVLRVVDCMPGYPPIMHRTPSLDYGIVIEGTVECHLDDGEVRTFHRGDICVQRGTNHGWKAVGNEPARICFVVIPIPPVQHQGKVLESHGYAALGHLLEEASRIKAKDNEA